LLQKPTRLLVRFALVLEIDCSDENDDEIKNEHCD
jgi:hypothetical protein